MQNVGLTIDRWWQDYSKDINTEKNPVRGDRATIENLTIKIQWLYHRFQRFMIFLYFVCYHNVTSYEVLL